MNNLKMFIIIPLVFAMAIIPLPVFADEQKATEESKDYETVDIETSSNDAYSLKKRFSHHVYAGVLEGYDNNVFLDPSRKGDTFDQAMADITLRYRLTDKVDIKARYDFTSITYHEFTTLSMMDNDISASFEYYPHKQLRIEAGYDVDFIDYFKNKDADFTADGPFAGVRYYVNKNAYVGAKYQYYFYDYKHRDIRDGTNNKIDITREDHRNNISAEAAVYMGKLFLKLKNTYYFNESNDGYMDYYDYQSERVSLYTAYAVTKKLSLLLNGGYQYKDFKSRKTIDDPEKKEHDHLMRLGAGVNYEIIPSFYISANYTYRQNYSNNPIQEYSGSVTTAGISYFF